jgi:hypothetical protein
MINIGTTCYQDNGEEYRCVTTTRFPISTAHSMIRSDEQGMQKLFDGLMDYTRVCYDDDNNVIPCELGYPPLLSSLETVVGNRIARTMK